MEDLTQSQLLTSNLLRHNPSAMAWINGSKTYPELNGLASFYDLPSSGTIISVEIHGLPDNGSSNFYGMHIHEFGDCTPPFDKTGSHYNPTGVSHPYHAGDLPPLLGNNGYAWIAFYDSRFQVKDILGKSIVVHSMRDDFKTQPAGDSGVKIGCGVIR